MTTALVIIRRHMFETEARDLKYIGDLGIFRVPEVLGVGDLVTASTDTSEAVGAYLLLEYIRMFPSKTH